MIVGRRSFQAPIGALLTLLSVGGCSLEGLSVMPARVPTRPDAVSDGRGPTGTDSSLGEPDDSPESICLAVGPGADAAHRQLFNRVNDYREENALVRLRYSQTLERAADDYAVRLAREDFFDHVAPDGAGPDDRAIAAGFCTGFVGENLAYGLNSVATADEAMQGFIDSPDHNENMLAPQWRYLGIGFFTQTGSEGEEFWWVQLFGAEPSM